MTNLHGRLRHNHGTIDTWSDNRTILNLVFFAMEKFMKKHISLQR